MTGGTECRLVDTLELVDSKWTRSACPSPRAACMSWKAGLGLAWALLVPHSPHCAGQSGFLSSCGRCRGGGMEGTLMFECRAGSP